MKLLSRDEFRIGVFRRDNYQCVICRQPAVDAHHILERRLFEDGGYYLDNGASLCAEHHLAAEQTNLTCEAIRDAAKISIVILPSHLEVDQRYDKWGNPILSNGNRLPGELFFEVSVQRILTEGGVLPLFTTRVKYPRTLHLPWSKGVSEDDKVLHDLTKLETASEIVVTEKLDGENTTFYNDYLHARSVEYHPHPSRTYIKALHARVARDIPVNWRVCGENLYARHSIEYTDLPEYFMIFSVWNEKNVCLSWDETCEWAALLGLPTVPVLYRGIWDEAKIKSLYPENRLEKTEGYVVRLADSFTYREFKTSVAKFVREQHVQTDQHWMNQKIIPNRLRMTP